MKMRIIGAALSTFCAAAVIAASAAVPASAEPQADVAQAPASSAEAHMIDRVIAGPPTESPAAATTMSVTPMTGQVEWACVGPDGSVYFLHGANARCTGSYLQEYIDGQQIRTIAITQPLPPGDESQFDCLIALIGVAGSAAAIETVYGTVIFVAAIIGAVRTC